MILKSHHQLEEIIPQVGEYEVAVLTAASSLFTGEAPIIYLEDSSLEIDLYKDRLVAKNDFMVWSFQSELGWDLLGFHY